MCQVRQTVTSAVPWFLCSAGASVRLPVNPSESFRRPVKAFPRWSCWQLVLTLVLSVPVSEGRLVSCSLLSILARNRVIVYLRYLFLAPSLYKSGALSVCVCLLSLSLCLSVSLPLFFYIYIYGYLLYFFVFSSWFNLCLFASVASAENGLELIGSTPLLRIIVCNNKPSSVKSKKIKKNNNNNNNNNKIIIIIVALRIECC